MSFFRRLFGAKPPSREQATMDGLRAVREIADRQIRGEYISHGDEALARRLLAEMPSWEDLYQRERAAWTDLFGEGRE